MKAHLKVLVFVVVAVVAVSVGVYAYYLTMSRVSLLVYRDSKVTGCKKRLNETVMLHVMNDGTVNLYVNACAMWSAKEGGFWVTYVFQSDVEIPVGVEAIIAFPAAGGEVSVETVSGPPGVVAGGGVYAISDNPDPNPFPLGDGVLRIFTRSGVIGAATAAGISIAFMP